MCRCVLGAAALFTVLASQSVNAQEAAESDEQLSAYYDVLLDDPEDAFALLNRHNTSSKGQPEFDLQYAYFDYLANGRKSRQARNLKQAIERYDASGGAETYFLGRVLTDYAAWQLEDRQSRFARETAQRAERIITATRPEDLHARMRAILWSGYSHTLEDPLFDSDLINAYNEFSRARALFSSQPAGSGSVSGEYEAIAAQAAAAGLLATRNPRAVELEQMGAFFQLSEGPEIDSLCADSLTGKAPSTARNAPDWAPHFTSRLGEGHIVSVNFSENGRMEDFRVVAEPFPPIIRDDDKFHTRFRDRDLKKALKRWRTTPDAAAQCRKNRLIVLTGYSRNEDSTLMNPRQVFDDLSRY